MTVATVPEEEFIKLWNQSGGSAAAVAKALKMDVRAIYSRRNRIENKLGQPLLSASVNSNRPKALPPGRIEAQIPDGVVLVGSDAHIWPGHLTPAQRGFIVLAQKLKLTAVIINGDLFDGATVSRHQTGMWVQERRPTVKQELEACQNYLEALQKAAGAAQRFWMWGNHDARYEARLSSLTPEYEGVAGFALKDHFPAWKMGMSLWVNDDTVIKHRWHNGVHAVYNNAVKGGKSIVTGHLHSLKVTPWTDWNGTRYGVDTGTLSDPDGAQFDYTEDNARNHRAGFAVLTFRNGRLLLPELAQVWDESHIQFRGELINV